jgi:hypothetical protein
MCQLYRSYATHNYHRSQEYTTHWVVIYKELHQPYQGRGFIMSSSGNNILIRKAACVPSTQPIEDKSGVHLAPETIPMTLAALTCSSSSC